MKAVHVDVFPMKASNLGFGLVLKGEHGQRRRGTSRQQVANRKALENATEALMQGVTKSDVAGLK